LKIKIRWVTEITHVNENDFFVDEQRIGPFKMWHHEHKVISIKNGVLMTDLVTYTLPMGLLGTLVHSLFIRKRLNKIFEFRKKALIDIFGPFKNE